MVSINCSHFPPILYAICTVNEIYFPSVRFGWLCNVTNIYFLSLTLFMFVCLFCFALFLGFFLVFGFFLCFFTYHWRIIHQTWPLPVYGFNADLNSALTATEQWMFISVPYLLWLGHIRSCHYLFLRLRSVRAGIRKPILNSSCEAIALTDCATYKL